MKLKTSFSKKKLLLLIVFITLFGYFLNTFRIHFIEFEGDLSYLEIENLRISGLMYVKNKSILFTDTKEFISTIKEQNPEVKNIEIYPKNISKLIIKVSNHEVCCVLEDTNTNKYLVSIDGKILKKINRYSKYPHEIKLNQEISINQVFPINSLKKIVEIENILLSKEMEIKDIKIEGDKIEMKMETDQLVVLDSETNIKDFIEKLSTMLDYLKQKNLSFKKMDFRFGNVIIE